MFGWLQGLLAAANCAGPDLVMPLIALVDYKGFRLIAMSLLPITRESLVLGSADGGITYVFGVVRRVCYVH